MRKKIAEGKDDEIPAGLESETIAREFWTLLGQLNAGRIEPLPVTDTRRFVERASNLPLHQAYPILAWTLENAIQRRGQAEQSRKLLRGFFEAALIGCELSHMLSGRAADKLRDFVHQATVRADQPSILIHSGQREVALQFIREWLMNNASAYLKICDPYFGPDDLEALQLVIGSSPNIMVSVLTRSHLINAWTLRKAQHLEGETLETQPNHHFPGRFRCGVFVVLLPQNYL